MKPILFNTEMVRAILDGRKVETRRIIKGAKTDWPFEELGDDCSIVYTGKNGIEHEKDLPGLWATFEGWDGLTDYPMFKAPFEPGEILYVRETWTKLYYVDEDGYTHYDQAMYYYAADGDPDITLIDEDGFEEDDQRIRWRPSIHMPKEAARIFLRVKDVRVEHLRDITEESAAREGLYKEWRLNGRGSLALSARQAFMWLWETITRSAPAAESWACNPWVWVIGFERCEKPEVIT